ncbi:MAG: alpha/beta hydrolase, partial [Clostridia bacterium]|nr:alpha/beta hydrolase [Clostridia bacterium]
NYDSVKPIRSIKALDPSVPALFLHGESDTYIAPKNVKKLYNAKRGVKAMQTFPLAGHSQSCYLYALEYNECIADFLEANVNK